MKSKSQKHQKSIFINWRKIVLTLFISITFLGIASGQTSNKDKTKTSKYKDSIAKSKTTIAKIEKLLALDTVKKRQALI